MVDELGGYKDSEWWRTHFSGILLDLWQAIVPSEQAALDADFLQAECKMQPGANVLDVPCGDGRVSLELAERGLHVTGVDISAGLIQRARQRAGLGGLTVDWHERDMRDLPWSGEFDTAFCWGDSFGYLDETGNREFLAAVWRSLKPGGRFALELQMIAEVLFPRFHAEHSAKVEGIDVHIKRDYDARQGRLSVMYALKQAGKEETRSASYRIYTCGEVCRMLEEAGFVVRKLCGKDGGDFRIGADCLRIVVEKN